MGQNRHRDAGRARGRRSGARRRAMTDIDCPPTVLPRPTILDLASRLNAASNAYREAMQSRAGFRDTLRAAGRLARAADELTAAIADAVAEGDNRLS